MSTRFFVNFKNIFIFPCKRGKITLYNCGIIRRENLYFPALKRLDIRPLNPHRCRHTFASIMKKAGADELSIKKIMGHTSYKFTEKVYTHTEIKQLKQAVGKI